MMDVHNAPVVERLGQRSFMEIFVPIVLFVGMVILVIVGSVVLNDEEVIVTESVVKEKNCNTTGSIAWTVVKLKAKNKSLEQVLLVIQKKTPEIINIVTAAYNMDTNKEFLKGYDSKGGLAEQVRETIVNRCLAG